MTALLRLPVIQDAPPAETPAPAEATREQLRSRRRRAVRAKTESIKRTSLKALRFDSMIADYILDELGHPKRPKARAECEADARPCPWVSCQYHLFLDVSPATGAIKFNFPDVSIEELGKLPRTCALDVAADGGETLEETAALMNMTRERVRQIVERAIAKLVASGNDLREWRDHIVHLEKHRLDHASATITQSGVGGTCNRALNPMLRKRPSGHVWAEPVLDDRGATRESLDRVYQAYERAQQPEKP